MDKTTTLLDLKTLVQDMCAERDWDQYHAPKDLAIGAVTEAAELLEIFRFKSNDEILTMLRDPNMRTSISHELSDTLFFLLRFAQKYDFDLSEGFQKKMELNRKKYPIDQFKGSNKKYNET